MIEPTRLHSALQRARGDLLKERNAEGHWIGELSTSALSTATAISALCLVGREGSMSCTSAEQRIERGIAWLVGQQNEDGGWGDTDQSYSNIATTMLCVAAFHLAGQADAYDGILARAERYVEQQGGRAGLRRRYGRDKTFAVPILANYALAGRAAWSEVSPLPFELACFPQSWYRFLRLPVVSYAIPALVAIGQARFHHQPPWDPVRTWLRRRAIQPSLRVLQRIQPASGGYLEAIPLTSFVVMSLASAGRADHPVVRDGVRFILDSGRDDGSWPIDTNLATWNTTLAVNALAEGGWDVGQLDCLEWLLGCQNVERHPFTGADPGGWGWSDLTGAVPDADDTPGALLALRHWHRSDRCSPEQRTRIEQAVLSGVTWLLGLQNGDGGWPTFCRGWGKLPFDRSGADLTAHALRALKAWSELLERGPLAARVRRAIPRARRYLRRQQRGDGHWLPLWFGNQDHPEEENPVYGTAKVLFALRDAGDGGTSEARAGLEWLVRNQNADGGWSCGRSNSAAPSSVEETALATEALLAAPPGFPDEGATERGLEWLVDCVHQRRHYETSPIGFYFAKLWYHEKLYPLTFTVSTLGQAVRTLQTPPSLPTPLPQA